MKCKSLATIHDGSPYAEQLVRVAKNRFMELGGKVMASEAVAPTDVDMRQALTRIATAKPCVVYFPIFVAASARIVRQFGEIEGLESTTPVGGSALMAPGFLEAAGAAAVNFVFTSPDTSAEAMGPRYPELVRKYKEKYGEGPIQAFHQNAYDGMAVALMAIEKVAVKDAVPATPTSGAGRFATPSSPRRASTEWAVRSPVTRMATARASSLPLTGLSAPTHRASRSARTRSRFIRSRFEVHGAVTWCTHQGLCHGGRDRGRRHIWCLRGDSRTCHRPTWRGQNSQRRIGSHRRLLGAVRPDVDIGLDQKRGAEIALDDWGNPVAGHPVESISWSADRRSTSAPHNNRGADTVRRDLPGLKSAALTTPDWPNLFGKSSMDGTQLGRAA